MSLATIFTENPTETKKQKKTKPNKNKQIKNQKNPNKNKQIKKQKQNKNQQIKNKTNK